jgi:hypothetical protein
LAPPGKFLVVLINDLSFIYMTWHKGIKNLIPVFKGVGIIFSQMSKFHQLWSHWISGRRQVLLAPARPRQAVQVTTYIISVARFFNIPKREYIPNNHKVYQMSVKYTKIFTALTS